MRTFKELAKNKGVGLNMIPAELLQAGGCVLAKLILPIFKWCIEKEAWPVMWCGGKLINVVKGKGN